MTEAITQDEAVDLWREATEAGRMRPCSKSNCKECQAAASVIRDRFNDLVEAKLAEVRAERDALKEEVEERDEWLQIVETTPLDEFDKLGDLWIRRMAIARMVNAIASVFSKWANEGIMARFREQMHTLMHQAYVEGCMAGVKNERARSADRDRTIAEQAAELADLKERGARAVIAYHVAICSPKGEVPMDEFYDPVIAAKVERECAAVRAALGGSNE